MISLEAPIWDQDIMFGKGNGEEILKAFTFPQFDAIVFGKGHTIRQTQRLTSITEAQQVERQVRFF